MLSFTGVINIHTIVTKVANADVSKPNLNDNHFVIENELIIIPELKSTAYLNSLTNIYS